MLSHFEACVETLCRAFTVIEQGIPPPKVVPYSDSFVFRYTEESIEQCIVAKLARVITGLQGAVALHKTGLFQEQALLHRVLDELGEDITFLCYGKLKGNIEDLHKRYLEAFFMEDFEDPVNLVGSRLDRPMIPRQKIRTYISRIEETEIDPSTTVHVQKILNQAYSGFVHGAAPHILEMYGGDPPRFHLRGMRGTPREKEYLDDLANYVYRGLINLMFVATTFGLNSLVDELYRFRATFEKNIGLSF